MWIEEIHIRGFGPLRGRWRFDPRRPTVVVDDNEAGKSHLVAAILAGLYGLEQTKRSSTRFVEEDRFLPWDGSVPYGLALTIRGGGRRIEIDRDFAAGRTRVRDADTGEDLTGQLHGGRTETVGDRLLGLRRDQFLRTALVRQGEIDAVLRDDGGERILDAVQRVLVSTETDISPTRALEVLENAASDNFGVKFETKLKRLSKEIAEKEAELRRLRELRESLDQQATELHSLDATIRKLRRRETEALVRDRRRRGIQIDRQLDRYRRDAAELDRLKGERDRLEKYAPFPADRGKELIEISTRLQAIERDLEEREKKRGELEKRLSLAGARWESFGSYAWADPEAVRRVAVAEGQLQAALVDERTAREAAEEAEREFVRRGGDPARREALHARIDPIDPAVREEFERLCEQTDRVSEAVEDLRAGAAARRDLPAAGRGSMIAGSATALAGGISVVAVSLLRRSVPGAVFAAIVALGLALVAGGLAILHGARRLRRLRVEEDRRLDRELRAKEEEQRLLMRKRDRIASELGFADADELLESLRELQRLDALGRDLDVARARWTPAAERARRCREALVPFLERSGISLGWRDVDLGVAKALLDAMRAAVAARTEVESLEKEIGEIDGGIRARREEYETHRRLRREILAAAGIDEADDRPAADRAFAEGAERHRRYRRLCDEEIPALEKRIPSPEEIRRLEAEKKEIAAFLAPLSGIREESADSSEEPAPRFEEIRRHREEVERGRRELERRIGRDLEDYQENHPRCVEELEELRTEQERVLRFREAVEIAAGTFRRITEEGHRNWAAPLSAAVGSILPRLNPRYRGIRFQRDFSIQVLEADGEGVREQRAIDHQLSTGAREQVYLAVRLALAAELSRAREPIPVLLDEPLAHADDERFERAMRFLLGEYARDRQVILLTCHRERHERLAARAPELFGETGARIVSMRPAET